MDNPVDMAIDVYRSEVLAQPVQVRDAIEAWARYIDDGSMDMSEAFAKHADGLAAALGASAANQCEDEQAQDRALGAIESWVSSAVANDTRAMIEAIAWMYGADKLEETVREEMRGVPKVSAYASGSGSLSFKRFTGDQPSGRRPTLDECIKAIRGVARRPNEGRWLIVNQGALDRPNHDHFEAIRHVERIDERTLRCRGVDYRYDPAAGDSHGRFEFECAKTGQISSSPSLNLFLKWEAQLIAHPERIVWDSVCDPVLHLAKPTVANGM